jgi:hypothetical protein
MPKIPSGAKTTNLAPVANAARQSGFLSRISTAVRYAIAGVAPDTWMSPNQPVTPVAQDAAGRQFDYPVGVNLTYTPRNTELTSFQQLRALADRCDLVRMAIETRKDQMASMVWSVTSMDDTKEVDNDPREKAITALLTRPDGIHSWQSWLRMLMEEVMVTDASSIYVRRRNNGDLYSFELIDGTTIKPLIDDGGRQPLPPSPAYQQILKGIPAVDYTSAELVYTPRNPRVHKVYGFSPVEQIILTVNIALRRMASQLQYFTEGNIPAAFASVPIDWSGQQIKEFQAYWDSVIEGDQGYKRKVRFVPGGTKVESVKDAPLKDEFDEWLARVVCYAFSLPPTAFIKQINRSTSETQQEAALKEGLAPLMVWVKEVMDHLIQVHLGCPDLQFRWVEEDSLDPGAQATILTTYQKAGIYSINEIRNKLGEDPITDEGGDAYLIFTASGAMTLEDVIEPPPAPPVGVIAPAANGETKPGDPAKPPKGGKKPPAKPEPGKPKPAAKHDHGGLTKRAEGPPSGNQTKMAEAFGAALEIVRDAAVKQAGSLNKAADGTPKPSNNYTPEEITLIADDFATALDTSGLALAWDDYTDTLQAIADNGVRQEVARIIAMDPEVAETAKAEVASIFAGKDPEAIQWASEHAAEMLSSDGTGGKLADATRNMVRETITTLLQDPTSDLDDIASALQDAYAFSSDRAQLIAATELHNAQSQGGYRGALKVGMKFKKWLLSNDEGICPTCSANAAQAWVPVEQPFQSGDDAPLAHPNCRCGARYKRINPEA